MPEIQTLVLAAALAITQAAEIIKDTGDAWILAKVAQGETGRLFPDTNAERWVMWTVKNRVASPDFPDDYWAVVEQGYNGQRLVHGAPDQDLIQLAREVIAAPLTDDPTDGCLYEYSADDVRNHNFSLENVVHSVQSGRWGLFFFREMPRREG